LRPFNEETLICSENNFEISIGINEAIKKAIVVGKSKKNP